MNRCTKIMLRNMGYLAACGLAVVLLALAYTATASSPLLDKVKSGELQLTCRFNNGERIVPPNLVKDYQSGTWVFTNGRARSCTTK